MRRLAIALTLLAAGCQQGEVPLAVSRPHRLDPVQAVILSPTSNPSDPGSDILDPEAPPVQEGPVYDELRALTRTALQAWKAGNLDVMKALAPPGMQEQLAAMDATSPRAVAMFGEGSWRASVAKVWTGNIGVVRIDGNRALVEFARFGDGRVVCADAIFVAEEQEPNPLKDHWYFSGIIRTQRTTFQAFGSL